jgi:hypothetical protein
VEVRKGGKNAETCECEEAREEDLKLWLKSVSCLSLSLPLSACGNCAGFNLERRLPHKKVSTPPVPKSHSK